MDSFYRNKFILAPMVRVGTLPMRLLALNYGADLVYSEELIDWKLIACERRVNNRLNTIDFIDPSDGSVTFRTCDREKPYVILQMGTCDEQRALTVGKKYQNDISAIDINMGCPKEFSIKGGMGAALLKKPDKVKKILTTLVNGLNIPVTCKIRLMPSIDDTVNFCLMAQSCGVAAIAIHGRRRDERPRHSNHDDEIKAVAEKLSVPVIANGGSRALMTFDDLEAFRLNCGAISVMMARTAMWNCSVFRRQGLLPLNDVIKSYLRLCIEFDHPFTTTKYCVQQMLRELQTETERGRKFLVTSTLEEICNLWDLGDVYRQVHRDDCSIHEPDLKRPRIEDDKIVQLPLKFIRGHYNCDNLPKVVLNAWCHKNGYEKAIFTDEQSNKMFRSIVNVAGVRCASLWEKNKRFAQQGAALVCVSYLGIKKLTNKDYKTVCNDKNVVADNDETKCDKSLVGIDSAKENSKHPVVGGDIINVVADNDETKCDKSLVGIDSAKENNKHPVVGGDNSKHLVGDDNTKEDNR